MKQKSAAESAPSRKLSKIAITENQLKVIKDKYLRDAPSVEVWLDGVAHNIALAELIFHPDAEKWSLFEGVKHAVAPVSTSRRTRVS